MANLGFAPRRRHALTGAPSSGRCQRTARGWQTTWRLVVRKSIAANPARARLPFALSHPDSASGFKEKKYKPLQQISRHPASGRWPSASTFLRERGGGTRQKTTIIRRGRKLVGKDDRHRLPVYMVVSTERGLAVAGCQSPVHGDGYIGPTICTANPPAGCAPALIEAMPEAATRSETT
ncbi:hypothetical protein GGTG_02603 [Gaeumannomyces tritici R3-111a-1]|uniref:Uncharacterized protein n=1 Tax=Gaeumannomyces tritici (strain R3-111a-1) TaxID=644352 RepID=J3NMU4_GAET3|nr:hypothetical protein GGTG_02603 [Gaeumannomyces tritici R3-111a-1]EJT77495.1 hypothetical protein GGTG_02603 [Gaeumannomyces tritici R3-111a-1]